VIVVLPYWLYSKDDPITQVSIPHSSRDSFIVNTNAGLVFWLIPYGLSIIAFPYVYTKAFGTRAWPLAGSIAVLMLLGTGGTTPIPKLILRGAFDVLTLDRFTFWAAISMLPLMGAFVASIQHGRIARLIREQLSIRLWYALQILLVVIYLLISIFVANLTQFRKFQPQPNQVKNEADTEWITALSTYPTVQIHDLVRRDGHWYIVPNIADPTTPPDTFFRQGAVIWYAQGRRHVSTSPVDPGDILDQPDVRILSARLVKADRRYWVVGEMINVDIDPADTTVTALLSDEQGHELTRYDAQTGTIHKLLPKEVVPFRVGFEGVAGSILSDTLKVGDFKPNDYTPPNLLKPTTQFVMQSQAVVTARDLTRNLAIQDLQVVRGSDGLYRLNGRLLNIGTDEATIPHVLVTLYDADGSVAWVDDLFVEQAIRPQRSRAFSVVLHERTEVETIASDQGRYATVLGDLNITNIQADHMPLPPESGFASLRISVHAYVAGGG